MAAPNLRGSYYTCKAVAQVCGSNGRPTSRCCPGLECEPLSGSFDMMCKNKHWSPPPSPPCNCQPRNALCGTNGHQTSSCCAGLECQPMRYGSQMRCEDRPYPPPPPPQRRNTCRELGCGNRGDTCNCEPWCVEYGTCCYDYNWLCRSPAPAPWPTPSPWYPAPTPSPWTPRRQGSYIRWSYDSNYCMSVDNNHFRHGQRMQLWHCKGGSGQYFQFDNSNSPSLLRASAASQYCVVINGNKDQNGGSAFAQLWECDSHNQAQHWVRQWVGNSMWLRNAAFQDKCLVVDNNSGKDGQKLQLWSCDDQRYQTWKYGQ